MALHIDADGSFCHFNGRKEIVLATMNISVPDPMRDYVQDRIENGQYASVSDYVRELIRRDQTMIEDEARWLAALDASLAESVREMAVGGGVDLDAACDGLLAELDATGG